MARRLGVGQQGRAVETRREVGAGGLRSDGPAAPAAGHDSDIAASFISGCLCDRGLPCSARILPLKYHDQAVKDDGVHRNDKIASAQITFGKVPSFSLFKENNDVLVPVKKENAEEMFVMAGAQRRHGHLRTSDD